MPKATCLTDLPDVLIVEIATFAAVACLHDLMQLSRQFCRLFRPQFCVARLFGADCDYPIRLDHTLSLIRQMLADARVDRHVVRLARHQISPATAIRLVDQLLVEQRCPPTIATFVSTFQFDLLRDIAPGLRLSGRPSRLTPKRWYKAFGIPITHNRIRIQVDPDIEMFLRELIQKHARPQFPTGRPSRLFEDDIAKLHDINYSTTSLSASLLERFQQTSLLTDPVVLWSLARIGFRIPIASYLNLVHVTVEQFARVAPFLCPRNDVDYNPMVTKLISQGSTEFLSIIFRLIPARTWLHRVTGGIRMLDDMLQSKQFPAFRLVSRYASWKFSDMETAPGSLLTTAIECNAPRDIIDFLLDCPPECLRNGYCIVPFRCATNELGSYVIAKLITKPGTRLRST